MPINVPGISLYFDHRQIKPFIMEQSAKAKEVFNERVVPALLRGTCRTLEVIANNSADAHDYIMSKMKPNQSA